MEVTKRDGSLEAFDNSKIERMVNWAVDGYKGVNETDIIVNSKFNLIDKISTKHIHRSLINSAINLFNEDTPNYQWVAARLVNYELRKEVWGGKNPPKLYDFIKKNIEAGLYDKGILEKYTQEEINKLDERILHDRDFSFTYAGIKQLCDKYLVQDRVSKQIYETPQFMYMLIAMVGFENYSDKNRLNWVKKAYDTFSLHKLSLPTPIVAGVRTPLRSYASCCLVNVGDSINSIASSWQAVGRATANRYGIGINVGKIRTIGSKVGNGGVVHTGLVPFIKAFESIVKSCQQNGLRGGGATVNVPFWHDEILDILVLKNNGGTEDNRVRKLDYTIGFSKLFWDRFLKDKQITLFSPHEVPDLYDAFGLPEFDDLYHRYEKNKSLKFRKKISARQLGSLFVKERTETGRIYVLNIDHANSHSSWADRVEMSNLCTEVITPTKPLDHIDDARAEIGICTLAALNMLVVKSEQDIEEVTEVAVRLLDNLLDAQDYFSPAARNFAVNRRSLGIGITNLAAYLAKHGYTYTDSDTPNFVDEYMEKFQYYLIKASVKLAKEFGKCPRFEGSKYSKGVLPIDTYKKSVDDIVTRPKSLDWEALRKEVLDHGMRHSTLSACMPVESSSVIQNATNGIEPIRQLLTMKGSKASSIPVLVPEAKKWTYTLAFEMKDNTALINVNAAIQKWIDMAISTNLYYKYANYPNNKLPDMTVIGDILYAYKMGLISIYYSNTDETQESTQESSCASGACTL